MQALNNHKTSKPGWRLFSRPEIK